MVAKGVVPAWTGAAACWAGWAGVLVEVELGWPGTVVAGERDDTALSDFSNVVLYSRSLSIHCKSPSRNASNSHLIFTIISKCLP